MILQCPCCLHRTFVDEALAEHLTRCDRCQNFVQVQSIFGAPDGKKRYRLVPVVPNMILAQTDHPAVVGNREPAQRLFKPKRARRRSQLFTLAALGASITLLIVGVITLLIKIDQLNNGGLRHAVAQDAPLIVDSHPATTFQAGK